MKEIVYIAGPMRGFPKNNSDAFFKAENRLIKQRMRPINPVRVGRSIATDQDVAADERLLKAVMDAELSIVSSCTAIYLLKGWELSIGARNELARAIQRGMKIMLEADDVEK